MLVAVCLGHAFSQLSPGGVLTGQAQELAGEFPFSPGWGREGLLREHNGLPWQGEEARGARAPDGEDLHATVLQKMKAGSVLPFAPSLHQACLARPGLTALQNQRPPAPKEAWGPPQLCLCGILQKLWSNPALVPSSLPRPTISALPAGAPARPSTGPGPGCPSCPTR